MKLNNRIGKYEVGRTLGEGNFGKVKYAIDVNTRKSYAIKMLDKDKVFHHNIVDHFKREICSLKFIKHPNVVRLYEVLASKRKIYIVLEYISGGELLDKISYNGKLDGSQARLYFQQLIDGVGYCHSRGVCHRDLKPENILLDAKGNVKICDFGLSALPQQLRVFFQRFFYILGVILMRGGYPIILYVSVVFQADGLLHTTCGSPNYVAPEVIAGRGYDGASADVWSCGVILFLLLTGRLPFNDNNLAVLYNKILKSEFECPKWLSPSTCNLIRRILDPNPKTRISIPEILEDEWFKQGYSPAKFVDEENTDLDDVDASYTNSEDHLLGQERGTTMMNAFQLIAMSSSLDLSGFFEEEEAEERKTLFTSTYSAKEIMRKIEETVTAMGFEVQKKNDKLNLLHMDSKSKRSGYLSVATEVFQVTPCLHVVEIRKSTGDIDLYRELCSKLSSDLSLQESDREWEGKPGISAHCLDSSLQLKHGCAVVYLPENFRD